MIGLVIAGTVAWLVAVGALVSALHRMSRRYPPARRRELIDELAADGALILEHQRQRGR